MIKLALLSFLLFVSSIFLGQSTSLDSLESLLATQKDGTEKIETLRKMANIAVQSDLKSGLIYAKRGVALAEQLGDKKGQAQLYEAQGRIYANLLQLDSAKLFFDKAMSGYTDIGNKKGQATTAFKMGWWYRRKNKIDKAMTSDLKALRLMEELGDQGGIANALGRVSSNLGEQGQLEEALEYAQRAVDICRKNDFQRELFFSLTSAGDACIMGDKPAQALEYYNEALDLGHSLNMGLAYIASLRNSRGNALKQLGRYDEALKDYKLNLEGAKKVNYINGISDAYGNMGEINLLLGRYSEALPYQLKAIALQEKDGDLASLVENYQYLSTIYAGLGDFKSALTHQKKAFAMRDSTASVQSDIVISELRTQYETEKKEATIASQQELIWLGLGLAAVLAFLAFNFYRNSVARKKTNKLLATKNAENELLLKEIHHRVKNNLQTISSLLSLQSESITDPSALDAVQESKNRVASMALIHQKLYQGENLAAIEMRDYFETIGKAIIDSFGKKAENVSMLIEMEKIELDVDTAVPIGLITNELITNSIKHAFPNKEKGQILISLIQAENGLLKLQISDDGQGTKDKSVANKSSGFGSLLIQLLTTQLGGVLEKSIQAGTSTILQFPLQEKSAA